MNEAASRPHPPRPPSAVSTGVGIAGLAGLILWMAIILGTGTGWLGDLFAQIGFEKGAKNPAAYAALINVLACGIPMVLWSVFVDRVHRNPSTGIDWDGPPRSGADVREISLTKLAGLWATWALIAALYCIARWYWRGNYLFAMELFQWSVVPLFALSIPYVLWLDKRLIEPRDGAWHLGAWLMGQPGVEHEQIYSHLRSWAVKAFFLAFMVSIVPGAFSNALRANFGDIQNNPLALAEWLMVMMFVIDIAFATVGYVLTMKPLDAHIRSATPYAAGWVAALACYPPFGLMNQGGPLDYQHNERAWIGWLADWPVFLYLNSVWLVFLTGIYAWATVAFGLRFSNLTDRGILTHGPYAFTKHPAYVSKNLFWWFSAMPFLAMSGSMIDMVRNTSLLAIVSGIYYWRAKTEEWHLSADPDYRNYAAWMAEYGLITRLFTRKPLI